MNKEINTCKICGNKTELFDKAKVLDKYDTEYYHCPHCDFIQTEAPFWLDEAYEIPINKYDTGIMIRNNVCVEISKKVLKKYKNKNILDYAGGYGIFTRMMRDLNYNVFWYDKYCDNLLSAGYEWKNQKIDVLTIFECFEHFVEPISEIENLFSISDTVLLSTLLFKENRPKMIKDWWYYAPEHGQHISFYSEKTFKYLANRFKCKMKIIKPSKNLNFVFLERKKS